MRDLHDRLERRRTRAAAIVSKQAIHGLGGVGKTRLAIEYALRHQAEYSALLFVGGASPEGLRNNLAALCARDVLDLPEQEAREEEARYQAAVGWLRDYSGWLLIVDNVDTPEAARAVETLARSLGDGHVLITARVSSWSAGVEALELDVLAEEDAVAFLLERTEGRRQLSTNDAADALALARAMGGLAVALEQAGAYIGELRLSLHEYLGRWQQGDAEVRSWNDEALTQYPHEALVTWNVTIEQLDGPARTMLELLSFFTPEPIPRFVLETDRAREVLDADPVKALAGLTRFSLVRWEEGNHACRIHRLVQEVTRERLPPAVGHARHEGALAVLDAAVPADPPPNDVRSWPVWDSLRPHVTTMVAAADEAGITAPTTRLMNDLGLLLSARGAWQEAEPLMRRALAVDEVAFGAENPDVAGVLNNLAQLLRQTNRMEEAEPLMRRALAIVDGSPGAQHSKVSVALNNLALLLSETNRMEEAEPLMRRALAIDEQSLGAGHPRVAIRLSNLAMLLKDTNRLEEAEPLMRRALEIAEGTYGPEHPTIATRLNNLAQLLKSTKQSVEAEPLSRRALEILLRFTAVTGHRLPNLQRAANNLRLTLTDLGRTPAEAEAEVQSLARRYGVDL
jgi:tetratricopeptide (TPR) repeat protein